MRPVAYMELLIFAHLVPLHSEIEPNTVEKMSGQLLLLTRLKLCNEIFVQKMIQRNCILVHLTQKWSYSSERCIILCALTSEHKSIYQVSTL